MRFSGDRLLAICLVVGGACSGSRAREREFSRAVLDHIASGPAALAGAFDPERGLLLIDHYQGGGVRSYDRLCGAALKARVPALADQLASEREEWAQFGVTCAAQPPPPVCVFYPGEVLDHGSRYIFSTYRGRFVLEAIVRFEAGAMDTTVQDRYIAEKLAEGRASPCAKD